MATKIDMNSIRSKVVRSKPVLDATERIAKTVAFGAQAVAETEFSNNDITKEIIKGPFAKNISGLLNGYGNLFSFIGFVRGTTPAADVLAEFKKVSFKGLKNIIVRRTKAVYEYKFSIPSSEDFLAATPLPWLSGRSWLKGISQGISNFGYYLAYKGRGRSSGGKQEDHKLRNATIKTDPYFTRIYNTFSKVFKPWIKF
jgi:hypothetical protein